MTVVKVAVNKKSRRRKLGLKFHREDESSPLTIRKISEGGLFDDTPLIEGLVVLKINDEDATWISPQRADSILHEVKKGKITVTAEGFVGKIAKESRDEKLGIILHKPKNSSDIFIWKIKDHSKFAGTDLKSGMKIITINGYQCPPSPREAVRLMQRTIGKLKIVAVEVNRPKPQQTSHTHVRVEVNSKIPSGSSHDETSQEKRDVKEVVSIVPSSISSVSGVSISSSKSSLSQRVKAMFKSLTKDERSVETEAMTDSSLESIEKQSHRIYRKKSRKRPMRVTKPQDDINFVSHGDISDTGDLCVENPEMIQAKPSEHPHSQDLDNISAVSSSEYIPLVEGEPYEESISSTKQVIHYLTDRITVYAEPDPPDEPYLKDLTLLNVVSIAEEEAKTSSSFANDSLQPGLSMVDDNATLFGEDISLPPDFTEEDGFPSNEDAPVTNHLASARSKTSPPEHRSLMTKIPPRYPKLKHRLKERAKRNQRSQKNDKMEAPVPLKHEHGILQDIGEKSQSQAPCLPDEDDEIIEEIEGDSYDMDEDMNTKFQLDPPRRQEKREPEQSTSPHQQTHIRRGVDPSAGGVNVERSHRFDAKKLEPPGSRAGVIEPNGKKGRDPEALSRSQESRPDSRVHRKPPEIIVLNNPPRPDSRVHRKPPEIVRLNKPPVRPPVRSKRVHPNPGAGSNFIPQEVWDEMHSDFTSFWGRQKSYVESSWSSLMGCV